MEEFGADLVTITDEDGVEYDMEILLRFEYQENEYIALTPADADEDEDVSLEVSILRVVEENGEEILEAVEDETELQGAYDTLMELIFEDEETAEDSEGSEEAE